MSARVLQPSLTTTRGPLAVNPWGGTTPFETDGFEGAVFFAHRLPRGEKGAYDDLLDGASPPWMWEIEIQGRLKSRPSGPVMVFIELRDGPMRLGLVTRSLCRALLKLIQVQAAKRDFDIRFSFGNESEYPMIAFPLLGIDRMYVSDGPTPLPIEDQRTKGAHECGTWRLDSASGQWAPVDRASLVFDDSMWVTSCFSTGYIDWSSWEVPNIPGLGVLDLEYFWGPQDCWLTFVDSGDAIQKGQRRTSLVELRLSSCQDAGVARSGEVEQAPAGAAVWPIEFRDTEIQAPEGHEEQEITELDEEFTKSEAESLTPPDGEARELVLEDAAAADDDLDLDIPFEQLRSRSAMVVDTSDPSVVARVAEEIARGLEVPDADHVRRNSRFAGAPDSGDDLPSLPWYFLSSAGMLWWCVCFRGRECWRHHQSLLALCKAVDPSEASARGFGGSVLDLECSRRVLTAMLRRARLAPGLLDEFLHVDTHLADVLNEDNAYTQESWVGVVEAEGRVAERFVRFGPGNATLLWRCTDRDPTVEVCVGLGGTEVEDPSTVLGSPAVVLRTPHCELVLLFRSAGVAAHWVTAMRRSCRVPEQSEWRDFLGRWPPNRVVLNDAHLCLRPHAEPLQLSAQLLREALAAQGSKGEAPSGLRDLGRLSSELKGVDLAGTEPQDVWGFWVNVFHCLLMHAQLVKGRPKSVRKLMEFYCNVSYVVAGHLFSLADIEHGLLRANMSRPRTRFLQVFVRVWRRSDEDLELRPCINAPACPAESFRCRADWRLNLVLSAGNAASGGSLPVFEPATTEDFDALVWRAMAHTFSEACGRVDARVVELPYVLCRFRDDVPLSAEDPPSTGSERRWVRALRPLGIDAEGAAKLSYRREYRWKMRERLALLDGCQGDDEVMRERVESVATI